MAKKTKKKTTRKKATKKKAAKKTGAKAADGVSDMLQAELKAARARIKELEAADGRAAREQIERLSGELGAAKEHLCGHDALAAEVTQLREDQHTAKLRVAVLQERNGELMANKASLEDQIKKLEESFREQRRVLEESIEREKAEAEHARSDLTKAQETITALEQQLKESAETTATLRGEMSQTSRLRRELVAAEETIEALREKAGG